MTVYQSLGTDPSAYLNGRMLELYKDVDNIYAKAKKSNSIMGLIAWGTIASGFTLSALLKDRGACFYSSVVLGPLIGSIAEHHRQNKTPKKVKKYFQRRFGKNFNESGEYQEILNLRKHIAREREAQRRAPVYITSSKKIEKPLFDEYVQLKSQSDGLRMSADLRSSDHRRLVLSYHLHENLPAFANQNPAIQLDRAFRIHDTELEARNLEGQAAEIDRQIEFIEGFHPEIKAEYAKIFPKKK